LSEPWQSWFVATMIIAVITGLIRPAHPQVNKPVLMGAQAVIGTMLGINIHPDIFPLLLLHLPAIIGVISFTIAISLAAALVLPRISSLSRETAAMGSLPGGANAMIALSIGTKADTKIVGLMQYLRLILVILISSLVAKFLIHHVSTVAQHIPKTSPVVIHCWYDYALMPLVAVAGVWIGRLIRLPTATLLGPMFLGLLISIFHPFHPVWPMWVPPIVYIIMGFYVGLLFDRKSLNQAGRFLPLLIANILVLIGFCALGGLVFSRFIGTSPLSGYLATSPGGGDTISIIAFGCGADVSLVFAVQILRALVIMFTGSYLTSAILHITRKQSVQPSK
jgi:membrane AbrB-like protein